MFLELMAVSFQGVMEVFAVGIIGYLIVAGITGDSKLLEHITTIVVRLAIPCLVFSTMVTSFDPGALPYWWAFPLVSIGINLGGLLLAWLYLSVDRTVKFRGEFTALVAFQNSFTLPVALAPVLFTSEQLSEFLNFLFLFNMVTIPVFFTLGIWLVNRKSVAAHPWKEFLNPPVVATGISCLVILTGLSSAVPKWLLRPVDIIGTLATPLSILFVGGIIVTNLRKEKPATWLEPIKITGLKCLIMPALASLLIFILYPPHQVGLFVIMQAVMPSALMVALIAKSDGPNQASIAGTILLTSLVSIFTIPLFMGIYGFLYGI